MSALDMLGGGGPPSQIPTGGGGTPGPDNPQAEKAIQDAIDSINTALDAENDAIDKATLSKIVSELHKYLGDQQKLHDDVMGGGPGAKMIRKATGTAPPSGPGY